MELTDSQCRIGLDDKCFEETAEYPSLTKLTDPSETDNLIAFRGNLDHKKRIREHANLGQLFITQ